MSYVIFAFIFFILGILYAKHVHSESFKKVILSSTKFIEMTLYMLLKEYMEMYNYGLMIIDLSMQKCAEEQPEKAEEFKKLKEVYSRKFDQFGNHYYNSISKIFPYDLKYKSYKQVKESFTMLINKDEENKDA